MLIFWETGFAGPAADYPIVSDVRDGVTYNSGAAEGTLDLPAVGDVEVGVVFDNGTKTGTLIPIVNQGEELILSGPGTSGDLILEGE